MTFNLKAKLNIMAGTAILAVILLTLMGYLLGKNASIGSNAYNRIDLTGKFVADIAPPALFMVEAANQAEQLYSLDKAKRAESIKDIKIHLQQFDDLVDKWGSSPDLPADVVADINKRLKPQGKEFQSILIKEVLEPAARGDDDALLKGFVSMEKAYLEHEAIVYDLVARAVKLNEESQANGISTVATYQTLLMVVAILSVVVVAFFSVYFSKLILTGLGADPEDLKRVTSSVARGDLDVSVNVKKGDGSVMSAVADMIESLKEGQVKAIENQRIRSALDSSSTNLMIANNDRTIIYLNPSLQKMFRLVEADLRVALPGFSADKVLESKLDIFQSPSHQAQALSVLMQAHTSNSTLANRIFRLVTSPIFDTSGGRLGTVVEWFDRTNEVAAEQEINDVVEAAGQGNFTTRINENGKEGFFLKAAQGLNGLVATTERGLNDITRVLGAIAKGDLTEKMEGDYAGTFAELKNYSDNTTESLSKILGEIRTAADTIFTASSEIASGNADLSSRTEQQAANLEETASSMEELTSTVKLNADNAKQANVLAERASTVASDGGALIQEVVVTMGSINESSQKIADIIGVIDGIAFQTNILALNAAVEAARAGDQGRGFAVVASEVRTLAQRSANAAKDIKVLISDSVKKIESGNTLVGKSGETMKEVVNSIKRVNDIMAEIAAASSEQSTGIEEVSNAVSHMDEMTQQNAALVEQAAAAAESLQSQADQLTQRVGQFILSEDSDAGRSNNKSGAKLAAPTARKLVSPTKKLSPPQNQDDEWESF